MMKRGLSKGTERDSSKGTEIESGKGTKMEGDQEGERETQEGLVQTQEEVRVRQGPGDVEDTHGSAGYTLEGGASTPHDDEGVQDGD